MPLMKVIDGQIMGPASAGGIGDDVWVNDDGSTWQPDDALKSMGSPEAIRPDLKAAYIQNQYDKTNNIYSGNPQAFSRLTAEQAAKIKELSFGHPTSELNAYMDSIRPNNPNNIHGNGLYGNGNDMWWGPAPGPQHTDNGGALSAEALLTGGLTNAYSEQGQNAWNDMRYGAAIMSLPFVGAGISAGLGALGAGAGAAGVGAAEGGAVAGGVAAGGAEAGAGAAGIDASTGLFAGESATSGAAGLGAAEGGALSGSTGSASLIGGAGSDTAGATAGADATGAFDTGASQGVFDSAGNPLYQSPSMLQYAQGLASQLGITPASALSFIKSNAGLLGGLLGLGAGAVGGGAKPAGTTTTTQDLPGWLKPYAQGNVAQGSNILSQLPSSAPLLSASQSEAMKTINGDYLNPSTNPYFASSVNDALGLAKSQFAGMYGGQAGSNINNSGFQEGLTRTLGQLATNAYSQNYQNERNRQATATFGAPQFASQSAAAPFAGNQAFSGLFPNVSSTTVPYFQNNLGNMFSGAVGGAALGKAAFG